MRPDLRRTPAACSLLTAAVLCMLLDAAGTAEPLLAQSTAGSTSADGASIGTPAQRSALVDRLLELSRDREAWSPPKEEALGYDPLEEMESVRHEVVEAETEEELFYALVKLSNARRDRHLSVEPVSGGLRIEQRTELRAPIDVRTDFSDLHDPAFFVSGADPGPGSSVGIGDRIVAVNGRTIPEYVETFTAWTRHSSVHGLLWHLGLRLPERALDVPPWLYRDSLELELEGEDGARYVAVLPYLPPDEIDIVDGEDELYPGFATVMERLNFHVLRPDDGRPIVILRWLDFEYELIQDVIDLMEYAEAEDILDHTLVIDVTWSSGGSRGAYAIQRLLSQPFRTTFGNIRISDAAIEMIEAWAAEPDIADAPDIFGLNESRSWLHEWARSDARAAVERGDEYTPATPFKLAHLPQDSDGVLQPAPVHFSGPVAIIAGPHGGSHLDQFVSMFSDNGLAPVVGMPAGGYSNTWEAEEVIALPGSGRPLALFMWNVGHTIRPNGEILEGNPVEPDVYVPLTRENFRTYHRALLELALQRATRSISD
ncbi:MAG: hypothetical protein HKN72_13525 [Gemmatimonadetes bacterium]|nr:hypothetical protein [Gemmatimonadota bacterium]